MNKVLQNASAIDLIDKSNNKLIFQVSATSTKQKIESALSKSILKDYTDYSFKFILISKEAADLRTRDYKNPYGLTFDPKKDIYDINSILNDILSLPIDKMKPLYEFIKSELGKDIDLAKIESNLAGLINLLSNEEWDDANKVGSVNSFEIDRKITHNKLNATKGLISENAFFYDKVDLIYLEFDKMGINKSNSVLGKIKREFAKVFDVNDPDKSFQKTVDSLVKITLESSNYLAIPIDELELCVEILVVDSFIRCKIFENPDQYNYATT